VSRFFTEIATNPLVRGRSQIPVGEWDDRRRAVEHVREDLDHES